MNSHRALSIAVGAFTVLLGAFPATATEPLGVTTQPLRSPLPDRVTGHQAEPRFLLWIGVPSESRDRCDDADTDSNALMIKPSHKEREANCGGYDLFETINTFAPAVLGTPSQSGWHDHPIPVGFVQIIQGTLWTQEIGSLNCLKKWVTGSVLIEKRGDIHNAFNFDPSVPAVLRSVFFIDRKEPLTRTDRPDPVTGDPNVASPPPTDMCAQ